MNRSLSLLGGLSPRQFLRDYWQKRPLLIRQALPGFKGLLRPRELLRLAGREDAQARLVTRQRGRYRLRHGPFTTDDFQRLGKQHWTVLVQGVNHFLPDAAALLRHFAFIPYARLDDLMVSYAPKGGGVGPHFDSYDVFLLQGYGHRRWQISTQTDCELLPDTPLRILRRFEVEQEWVLAPGDMLYLPPHCAHNGIAEDDCMTYSIGFRTPAYQELAEQFLIYLQDRVELDGMYADPDLEPQAHPSEIGPAMLAQVSRAIGRLRWDEEDVANFLGCYLSEPKPHIYFDPPARPLSAARFAAALAERGAALDLKTLMLCRAGIIFLNGESYPVSRSSYPRLRNLADTRHLAPGTRLTDEARDLLYQAYRNGYLHLARRKRSTA